MDMHDLTEEELIQLFNNTKKTQQSTNEMSQEELQMISMVDRIKKGDVESVQADIAKKSQPKIVEPIEEVSTVQQQINNVNYWKIDSLPSKNKFYKSGSDILGRPLKVLEVKKLATISEDGADFILNDILKKTITGIDVNDLYVADKLYIIFWLRANTYRESGYVVPYVCPKCENKSDYHFEIDKMEVQYVSDKFDPSEQITIGQNVITYDYLRVKDEVYITKFKELNKDMLKDVDDELLAMAQMIKTINGERLSLMQKYTWIIGMDIGQFTYLKNIIEKNGMGIKPYVMIDCNNCGGNVPVGITFQENFIIPECKFE